MHLGKRFKLNAYSDDSTPVNLSQPIPQVFRDSEEGAGDSLNEQKHDFCFSQPTQFILCTQMNPTQSTQSSFHRLVKRMTRFSVITSSEDTIKRIKEAVSQMSYTWKMNDANQITISTTDRRKIQLVFKINLIEMSDNILVDFRLSKGDGIEFKRCFIQIKKILIDIIGMNQMPDIWIK